MGPTFFQDTNFFGTQFFLTQNYFGPNIFEYQNFWDVHFFEAQTFRDPHFFMNQHFLKPKICWTKKFCGLKIFGTKIFVVPTTFTNNFWNLQFLQIIFWTQICSGPKFFRTLILLGLKIIQDPKFSGIFWDPKFLWTKNFWAKNVLQPTFFQIIFVKLQPDLELNWTYAGQSWSWLCFPK